MRWLDLDDVGTGFRHQQRRVRPPIDVAEIKHDNAAERQVGWVGDADPSDHSAIALIGNGLGRVTRRKRIIKTAVSPKGIQQNR